MDILVRILLFVFTFCLGAAELPSFATFPCEVAKPQSQPKMLDNIDLSKHDAKFLRYSAKRKYRNDDLKGAIRFQYWACQKDPNDGMYDLACYYSLNKQVNEAVYCLQQAAVKEGVKYDWAMDDRDLIPVMNSKHWDKLRPWLKDCEDKWASSKFYQTAIIRPKSKSKILLIGFHGYGSKPSDFAETAEDQAFADKFGATIVSVSASKPWGKNSFSWTEDIDYDYAHVDRVLKVNGIDLKKTEQKVILIGFSQGAQLSTEIMARHAKSIAGIIALCPGGKKDSQLGLVNPVPDLAEKKAVVICGADEHEGNLRRAKENTAWLNNRGAKVFYKKYKDMGHQFPETYYKDLEKWVSFIISNK